MNLTSVINFFYFDSTWNIPQNLSQQEAFFKLLEETTKKLLLLWTSLRLFQQVLNIDFGCECCSIDWMARIRLGTLNQMNQVVFY